jgi:hypothetical protein
LNFDFTDPDASASTHQLTQNYSALLSSPLPQNKMHINDWQSIQTLWEKLGRALERAVKATGALGTPRVYVKMLAELEDFLNKTLAGAWVAVGCGCGCLAVPAPEFPAIWAGVACARVCSSASLLLRPLSLRSSTRQKSAKQIGVGRIRTCAGCPKASADLPAQPSSNVFECFSLTTRTRHRHH